MDANDIMNALNGLLDLCDTLDNNGIGAGPATNWEHTTRDICKTELGTFLMYVGAGGSFFTDGQATLVNLLLSEKFGQIESWQMKSVADGLDAPLAANNATFTIFKNGDDALSQQNGTPTSQLTDMLISLYESFGGLMVAFNENALSKVRCDLYVNGLKARQGTGNSAAAPAAKPAAAKPAETPKPAAAPKKKAETKTVAKGGGGKTVRYDDRVSFDLPSNYGYEDTTDDDGKRSFSIKLNARTKNGSEDSDVSFSISIAEREDETEDILDNLYEVNDDVTIKRRYNSDPEALLIVNQVNMGFLGSSLSICAYRLYIRLAEDRALLIMRTGVSGDDDSMEEPLNELQDLWKTVQINGKKVKTEDMGSGEIASESLKSREEEEKNDEEKLDCDVEIDGSLIRIGNRWEMTLPFGWRAKAKREDEAGLVHVTIYAGSLPLGNILLGDSIGQQKKGNIAHNALLIRHTLNAVKAPEDAKIRDDAKLAVSVTCCICTADGSFIAEIETVEKELHDNKTLISLILGQHPDGRQGMQDALEKMKNKDYFLGHPYGVEYENKWMGALQLAVSIRPAGEKEEKIPLQARTTLYNGISACVPKGLKFLKGEDEDDADIYYPGEGRADKDEFLNNVHEYFLKVMGMDGSDAQDIHEEMAKNVQTGIYSRMMTRVSTGPIVERIRENYLENGYKALWLDAEAGDVIISVATNDKDFVQTEIHTETDMVLSELIRIGRAIYDSIEIDGESKAVCAPPFPPETQLFHEHYDLVTSGQYTTHRDADFRGQSIRELMEKCGSEDEDAYGFMQIEDDDYTLDREAVSLAKVFRMNEDLFDPYEDTEALIRKGMFKDAGMFQALRSLGWSVSALADRESRSPGDYSWDELEEIAEIIEENNHINYQGYSYCAGLCNHYDWHVFYVPDAYLSSDEKDGVDLRYLTGKENRGGNSITVFGFGGFGNMNRVSDLISRNEETLESLEALRKDLEDLLPVMRTIHDALLEGRDRCEKPEGILAEALTAWCALAVAAREPFYSEEAADTPEADAGLEGPLERPTDDLDDKPAGGNGKPVTKKPAAKPASKPASKAAAKPAGEVLDLGGATVIEPGQFAGNMTLKKIVIPEGVTEIGANAFYTCMGLEAVVFPKSLRKIGKFAFMSCRSLREVDLPEGVEEIETHAFGATNNLKQVHLPDSLKKVDRCLFGLGGDSPYATAYLSGKLAKQLYDVSGDQFNDIYARHLIIDGKPYESVKEFLYKECDIRANGYYPPYDPEAERRAAEQRKEKYRSEMEKACKEGKTLDEMIEAGRKTVKANTFGDREAFEQAIENLDREATVTFAGKHFALTGFGDMEEDVIAEIEKRGGTVHSSMTKSANYLIVCLDGPGSSKVKKALEWRQKGAQNQIVSDYQMWQAIFGKAAAKKAEPKDKEEAKPAAEPAAAPKKAAPKAKTETKPAAPTKEKAAAKPKAAPAAKPAPKPVESEAEAEEKYEKELERLYQMYAPKDSQLTAEEEKLLRMIIRMGGPQHKTVRLKDIAFELDATIDETKKMLGGLKDKLVLEWNSSGSIDFFMPRWRKEKAESSPAASVYTPGPAVPAPAPTAPAPRPAAPAPKPVMPSQNEQKRNEIRQKIARLESERDSLKGLFAGFKRKKIQAEIDALNDELRKI